jgi:hypothetical protein
MVASRVPYQLMLSLTDEYLKLAVELFVIASDPTSYKGVKFDITSNEYLRSLIAQGQIQTREAWFESNSLLFLEDLGKVPVYDSKGELVGYLFHPQDFTTKVLLAMDQNFKPDEQYKLGTPPVPVVVLNTLTSIRDNLLSELLYGNTNLVRREYEEAAKLFSLHVDNPSLLRVKINEWMKQPKPE